MIQVQDVAPPKRATAASLHYALGRMGGNSPRENAHRFESFLTEQVAERRLDLGLVLLEEVAKLSMGEGWRRHLAEGRAPVALLESGGPVTSDFFNAVTGQVIYSTIREAFSLPGFVFSAAIPAMDSGLPGTESVPEITALGDVAETVLEGQAYPEFGVGAAYYTLPASVKQGLMVSITEEALSFTAPQGLTRYVLAQASGVGTSLGLRKELNLIDVVIGYVNNYIRNGSGTDTYLTSGAYVNKQTSADLVDYTDIDSAEQLLNDLLDPTTGLSIARMSMNRDLVVSPARRLRAQSILEAAGINVGDITTGTGLQTTGSPNPLRSMGVRLIPPSQLMYRRILGTLESEAAKAADGWIYGDLAAAFGWKQIWPLGVFQQDAGSDSAFTRDVVRRWKARYHGVAFVKEPRFVTRNENSAWA